MCAEKLAGIAAAAGMGFVYKSSYDKANRTSASAARGVGMDEGLKILQTVKDRIGCPVLSDVHLPDQCVTAAEVLDVLQIPAFLCRQTDLLVSAAKTGAAINIKKGQFLAPWDMKHVAAKVSGAGNDRVMLCERGTSFGYNTLVSDMRSLQMASIGYPVISCHHSVQQPGGLGGSSGGSVSLCQCWRVQLWPLALMACSWKAMRSDNAPSDGPNMVPLDAMPAVLDILRRLDDVRRG